MPKLSGRKHKWGSGLGLLTDKGIGFGLGKLANSVWGGGLGGAQGFGYVFMGFEYGVFKGFGAFMWFRAFRV